MLTLQAQCLDSNPSSITPLLCDFGKIPCLPEPEFLHFSNSSWKVRGKSYLPPRMVEADRRCGTVGDLALRHFCAGASSFPAGLTQEG